MIFSQLDKDKHWTRLKVPETVWASGAQGASIVNLWILIKLGKKREGLAKKKVEVLQIYSGIMLHKELLTKLKSCIYCPAHLHKGKKSLSQKGKILKEKTEKLIFSPEVK